MRRLGKRLAVHHLGRQNAWRAEFVNDLWNSQMRVTSQVAGKPPAALSLAFVVALLAQLALHDAQCVVEVEAAGKKR
jgi:hypothetical protein